MGIVIVKSKPRFLLETQEEKNKLHKAREFFGTSYLLLKNGLNRDIMKRSASGIYNNIKTGRAGDSFCTISIEDWKLIEKYSNFYENGNCFNEETFEIPVI